VLAAPARIVADEEDATMKRLPLILLITLLVSACGRDTDRTTTAKTTVPAPPVATTTVTAPPPAVAGHDEHAAAATGPVEAPPAGQRWATDAPLRAGMARVRIATHALEPLQHGPMEAAQVRAQADEIQAAVNAMFAQCHLPPQPDAALHPLLAKLLIASQALRDKPADGAPLAVLTDVLTRYPQLFDDSEWPTPGK
jgi:hypothetical protein